MKSLTRIIIFVAVMFVSGNLAHASTVTFENLPDRVNYHDFVVGPGKVELQLVPGQSQTVSLTVANRLGSDKVFQISEEDFSGSNEPKQSVTLLGSDRGPYSLKDSVHISDKQVLIPFGKKAIIPITISVPSDAEPGGLYGSVIVSVADSNSPSNPVVTRIGTLFFVRVPGAVKTSGRITSFSLLGNPFIWSNSVTHADPISFYLSYKNDGNVYVDPSAIITIKNMFGTPVDKINVDPWFAMPQSTRFREITWQPTFLFGRYVAHAVVERGYGSTTDIVDLTFWVIPWKVVVILFIGLILLIIMLRWIYKLLI